MKEDRDRCVAAGMDDYLSKPIDLAKLEAALESWLPQARIVSVSSESTSPVA